MTDPILTAGRRLFSPGPPAVWREADAGDTIGATVPAALDMLKRALACLVLGHRGWCNIVTTLYGEATFRHCQRCERVWSTR